MSKFDLKSKVVTLRRRGYSLKEITNIVGVSKSTVALWCGSVILTQKQKERLKNKMIMGGHAGRLIGAQSNHEKKVKAKQEAYKEMVSLFGEISKRDRLIAGISLYWAEGSKADSVTGCVFVNSDPVMIHFMYQWLVEMMNVKKEDVFIHISINEIHVSREHKVLSFWSNLLDLPTRQFAKTFYSKAKQRKIYENHSQYFGVCRLGVRKSTYLKYKILALIDMTKAGVAQVVRANAS